jgi:hypothetical protein
MTASSNPITFSLQVSFALSSNSDFNYLLNIFFTSIYVGAMAGMPAASLTTPADVIKVRH